ncbi:hypothetical protein RMATCC62417_18237 [Rhizopus microsporus]|nr:hypothetical protein RMATCC62417_18216 [Rhizopus microsporus]CEG84434.1 hypothetical protein RMATCC62417_18237 [Rhizopus microsporus]
MDNLSFGQKLVLRRTIEKRKNIVQIEEYKLALEDEDEYIPGSSSVFSTCKIDASSTFLIANAENVITGVMNDEVIINKVLNMSQNMKIHGLDYAILNKSKNDTL